MDPVRIDLGLRIVVSVDDYRSAGVLMDDLHDAIGPLLKGNGRFDFTHFHTRPCKAMHMERLAEAPLDFAVAENENF